MAYVIAPARFVYFLGTFYLINLAHDSDLVPQICYHINILGLDLVMLFELLLICCLSNSIRTARASAAFYKNCNFLLRIEILELAHPIQTMQ